MSNPFLDAALYWAGRGFRVFPLVENSQKPAYEGWPDWATTDAAQIRALWEGSKYNVGICTTGMLVVDIDVKKDRAGLASWAALHGEWDTLTVKTRSGGFHLYYTGADVGLSAGALGQGLDIRSHNGYVVAPGSLIDGKGYEIALDLPLAPAPPHIVARCKPPGMRAEAADVPLVDLDTPAAIQAAQERVARTPEAIQGERSDQTYRLACAVRELGVSEATCLALMEGWAARSGISHDDMMPIVANAYLYAQNPPGQKHPAQQFAGAILIEPPPMAAAVPALQGAINGHWGNVLPLTALAPRPHVLRGFLLQGSITALLAPGGIGKSLLSLTAAAHLAVGADFLNFKNMLGRPAKSVIYNAEDDLNEMSMRLHAICTTHNLPFDEVARRVRLVSGKRQKGGPPSKVRFVAGTSAAPTVTEAVREFVAACSDPEVVMAALDPLNKLHNMNGNDNVAMTFVMETLETIAEEAEIAVLLAHHTSKPSGLGKRAGNADSGQGAGAVKDSARITFTLYNPDDEDAQHYGMTAAERKMLLRLDHAKENYGPPDDNTRWLRRVPVKLWNGEEVAALEQTDMHVRTQHLQSLMARTLAAGMIHTRGQAGVKLNDAAALLKGGDPLFEKLPRDLLKQRIQSYLAEPVTLEDGSVVVCREEGGVMMVLLR